MRSRLLLTSWVLLVIGIGCLLQGQVSMTGAGKGAPGASSTLKVNLISFWEFESGALLTDAVVASANDLTNNGTATSSNTAPTKVGNYLNVVSASSQYLSHASNASLQVNAKSAFSVAGWVYLVDSPGGSGYYMATKMGGDGTYRLYLNATPAATFTIFSTDGAFSSNSVTDGTTLSLTTWYYVAATVNKSGNVCISINAGAQTCTAYTITQSGGDSGTFEIGNDANTGTFCNCRIDQLGFWSKELTTGEISQLYNSGSGLSYAAM